MALYLGLHIAGPHISSDLPITPSFVITRAGPIPTHATPQLEYPPSYVGLKIFSPQLSSSQVSAPATHHLAATPFATVTQSPQRPMALQPGPATKVLPLCSQCTKR